MASFDKIKARGKKGPLGGATPPSGTETPSFINQPETFGDTASDIASSSIPGNLSPVPFLEKPTAPVSEAQTPAPLVKSQIDGGPLRQQGGRGRKTGRTSTFATRSSDEFIARFNKHCETTQLNKNVFLERLLNVWEKQYGPPGSYTLTPSKNDSHGH